MSTIQDVYPATDRASPAVRSSRVANGAPPVRIKGFANAAKGCESFAVGSGRRKGDRARISLCRADCAPCHRQPLPSSPFILRRIHRCSTVQGGTRQTRSQFSRARLPADDVGPDQPGKNLIVQYFDARAQAFFKAAAPEAPRIFETGAFPGRRIESAAPPVRSGGGTSKRKHTERERLSEVMHGRMAM